MLWLAPRAIDRAAEALRARSAAVATTGLLFVIGLPILGVVLVVSLVGLPLGLAALLALIPLGALGYVTACHALGRAIAPRAAPPVAFLAGWGVLRAAAAIPGVGTPLWLVGTIIGLGSLLVALWQSRRPPVAARPLGGPEAPLQSATPP
jgi:hypothetical protein